MPRSTSASRAALREAFPSLPPARLEVAELLISEAVANVIRHSGLAPHEDMRIRARADQASLSVEVVDRGTGPRAKRVSDAGGFGFQLFEALATDWGFERADERTRVWFRLDGDDRPSSGAGR